MLNMNRKVLKVALINLTAWLTSPPLPCVRIFYVVKFTQPISCDNWFSVSFVILLIFLNYLSHFQRQDISLAFLVFPWKILPYLGYLGFKWPCLLPRLCPVVPDYSDEEGMIFWLFSVLWIRIRTDFDPLAPDPHWECGSWSRWQKLPTKIEKETKFHVLKCWMFSF